MPSDNPANIFAKIAGHLARNRAYVEAAGEELAAATPFRKDLLAQE